MPLDCPTYTLGEIADQYCIMNGIDKRKYFKQYLFMVQEVWKDLYQNTLFATTNTYVELKKGIPFNYVDIPSNSVRFLGLSVDDRCHNLKPLYYNNQLNVLVKPSPSSKRCNCEVCDCSGLCETVGSLVPTTEVVNINGTDYTNTTWIKTCPNGDVMEYRTIWTTQYTFNRGSYDFSYDFSYEIGTSDSEVVQINLSRKLCALEVLPCGCPAQTRQNEECFFKHCGCFINPLTSISAQCCNHWKDCNEYAGSCRISECGTKVYIEYLEHFDRNHWLIMSFQTNGVSPDQQTNAPDYAKMCLWKGIYFYKNLFNDRINPKIKDEQRYSYIDEQNKIILYNNKFAIEDLQALNTMAIW